MGMSKGGLAEALAAKTDLKKSVCSKLISALGDVGAKEVKSKGLFTVHGLCRIKTKVKPATKAGKRMMCGKEVVVKAKPAKTVVKAFAVASLKQSILVAAFCGGFPPGSLGHRNFLLSPT